MSEEDENTGDNMAVETIVKKKKRGECKKVKVREEKLVCL